MLVSLFTCLVMQCSLDAQSAHINGDEHDQLNINIQTVPGTHKTHIAILIVLCVGNKRHCTLFNLQIP